MSRCAASRQQLRPVSIRHRTKFCVVLSTRAAQGAPIPPVKLHRVGGATSPHAAAPRRGRRVALYGARIL
eukprot:8193261-Pyramimonas_sp.AAC.1